MNILFENLLDHPNFVSAPKDKNENDDERTWTRSPLPKKEYKEKTPKNDEHCSKYVSHSIHDISIS